MQQLSSSNLINSSLLTLLLFIILSTLVKLDIFHNLDYEIFTYFQIYKDSLAHTFFVIFTKLSSTPASLIIFAIIFLILFKLQKIEEMIFSTLFLGLSAVGAYILKYIFLIQRPLANIDSLSGYSYPSGHAVLSLTLTFIILYITSRSRIEQNYKNFINILFLVYAHLSLFARIFLGAHWFSDSLAGILHVVFFFLISLLILQKITKMPMYTKIIKK